MGEAVYYRDEPYPRPATAVAVCYIEPELLDEARSSGQSIELKAADGSKVMQVKVVAKIGRIRERVGRHIAWLECFQVVDGAGNRSIIAVTPAIGPDEVNLSYVSPWL